MPDLDQMPYFNPIHLMFAMKNLDAVNTTVNELFTLMDGLDPIDRDDLITLTATALGGDDPDFAQQEDYHAYRFSQFRRHCERIEAMEHIVVHAIVMDILNRICAYSDPKEIDSRVDHFERFAKFIEGKEGCDPEKYRIMAEAARVAKKSDLQVARRRYDSFCEAVVKPLLRHLR